MKDDFYMDNFNRDSCTSCTVSFNSSEPNLNKSILNNMAFNDAVMTFDGSIQADRIDGFHEIIDKKIAEALKNFGTQVSKVGGELRRSLRTLNYEKELK